MTIATRTIQVLTLAATLGIAATLAAQQVPAAVPAATGTTAVPASTTAAPGEIEPPSSNELRNQFAQLLRNHPPELGRILALEPTLLANAAFLASYRDVARFVDAHPEVRQHPGFYLSSYETTVNREYHVLDRIFEMISVGAVFILLVGAFAWLIRTLIEQRRWNRLSRTQSEVHNKILDRFGSTEELMAYMHTPAGTKFLESAPIPLRSEPPAPSAPVARSILSIQIGVIVAAAATGMLLVSGRLDKESAEAMSTIGVIALCTGAGFVISAAVSLFLSRRFGLWQVPPGEDVSDAGFVK